MSKVLLTLFTIVAMGIPCEAAAAQDNAPPKELIQYVRDARKAGLNDQQIQQNTERAGWPTSAVNDAINAVAAELKNSDKNETAGAPAAKTPESATQKPENPRPAAVDQPAAQVQTAATGVPAGSSVAPVDATPKSAAPGGAAPNGAGGVSAASNSTTPGTTVSSAAPTPGVGNPSIKPAQPVNRGVPDDYQIGAGDVLHVNVWGEPTASVNGAVVRTDGKISLPLIHDIYVLQMTPSQAEKTIAEQLGRFLNAPDVAVIVGGITSKKIYVTGQVKKEGTIPFTYRMTVMQAISEAGGLTPYAKRKKIYVLRNEDGQNYRIPFDYEAVLRGEHMEMNVPLKPGDQLIVP